MARRTLDPSQTARGSKPAQAASRKLAAIDRLRGRGHVRVTGPGKAELFSGLPAVGTKPGSTSTIPSAATVATWDERVSSEDVVWTSTSERTISTAGYYDLDALLACDMGATGNLFGEWRKNGEQVVVAAATEWHTVSANVGYAAHVRAWEPWVRLNVGDVLTVYTSHNTSSASTWNQSRSSVKCLVPAAPMQLTKGVGSSIPCGEDLTWLVLAEDAADVTGTGLTEYARITNLAPGIYHYKVQLIWQATAAGTGMRCSVYYTGTAPTQRIHERRFVGTGTTLTTGVSSSDSVGASGNIYEAQGNRTNGGAIGGDTVGVDTADADQMATITGFVRVTDAGDLAFFVAAEGAGTVRACEGTTIELARVVP